MRLDRDVRFSVDTPLDRSDAVAFVRDVRASLRDDELLSEVTDGPGGTVEARLPVSAGWLGRRSLRFRSRLEPTPRGARLVGQQLADAPGWARVGGEAEVTPLASGGSRLAYRLEVEVHLVLPEPERWGGRALTRMIERTADAMLQRVADRFPAAVRSAADRYAATMARPG